MFKNDYHESNLGILIYWNPIYFFREEWGDFLSHLVKNKSFMGLFNHVTVTVDSTDDEVEEEEEEETSSILSQFINDEEDDDEEEEEESFVPPNRHQRKHPIIKDDTDDDDEEEEGPPRSSKPIHFSDDENDDEEDEHQQQNDDDNNEPPRSPPLLAKEKSTTPKQTHLRQSTTPTTTTTHENEEYDEDEPRDHNQQPQYHQSNNDADVNNAYVNGFGGFSIEEVLMDPKSKREIEDMVNSARLNAIKESGQDMSYSKTKFLATANLNKMLSLELAHFMNKLVIAVSLHVTQLNDDATSALDSANFNIDACHPQVSRLINQSFQQPFLQRICESTVTHASNIIFDTSSERPHTHPYFELRYMDQVIESYHSQSDILKNIHQISSEENKADECTVQQQSTAITTTTKQKSISSINPEPNSTESNEIAAYFNHGPELRYDLVFSPRFRELICKFCNPSIAEQSTIPKIVSAATRFNAAKESIAIIRKELNELEQKYLQNNGGDGSGGDYDNHDDDNDNDNDDDANAARTSSSFSMIYGAGIDSLGSMYDGQSQPDEATASTSTTHADSKRNILLHRRLLDEANKALVSVQAEVTKYISEISVTYLALWEFWTSVPRAESCIVRHSFAQIRAIQDIMSNFQNACSENVTALNRSSGFSEIYTGRHDASFLENIAYAMMLTLHKSCQSAQMANQSLLLSEGKSTSFDQLLRIMLRQARSVVGIVQSVALKHHSEKNWGMVPTFEMRAMILPCDKVPPTNTTECKVLYEKLLGLCASCGYSKMDNDLFAEVATSDGYPTQFFKKEMTIESFVGQIENGPDRDLLISSPTTRKHVVNMITESKSHEIPQLKSKYHIFSFDNGIFDINSLTIYNYATVNPYTGKATKNFNPIIAGQQTANYFPGQSLSQYHLGPFFGLIKCSKTYSLVHTILYSPLSITDFHLKRMELFIMLREKLGCDAVIHVKSLVESKFNAAIQATRTIRDNNEDDDDNGGEGSSTTTTTRPTLNRRRRSTFNSDDSDEGDENVIKRRLCIDGYCSNKKIIKSAGISGVGATNLSPDKRLRTFLNNYAQNEEDIHYFMCHLIGSQRYKQYVKFVDPMSIPSEGLDTIFDAQEFSHAVKRTSFGQLGRLLYPKGTHDSHQTVLYLKGPPGTGKSSISNLMIKIVGDRYVFQLQANTEPIFGLQGSQHARLVVAPETLSKSSGIGVPIVLQMCSGEGVIIATKNKGSERHPWTAQMLFCANNDLVGHVGALARRLLRLCLERSIPDHRVKGGLDKQISDCIHAILIKITRIYLEDTYMMSPTLMKNLFEDHHSYKGSVTFEDCELAANVLCMMNRLRSAGFSREDLNKMSYEQLCEANAENSEITIVKKPSLQKIIEFALRKNTPFSSFKNNVKVQPKLPKDVLLAERNERIAILESMSSDGKKRDEPIEESRLYREDQSSRTHVVGIPGTSDDEDEDDEDEDEDEDEEDEEEDNEARSPTRKVPKKKSLIGRTFKNLHDTKTSNNARSRDPNHAKNQELRRKKLEQIVMGVLTLSHLHMCGSQEVDEATRNQYLSCWKVVQGHAAGNRQDIWDSVPSEFVKWRNAFITTADVFVDWVKASFEIADPELRAIYAKMDLIEVDDAYVPSTEGGGGNSGGGEDESNHHRQQARKRRRTGSNLIMSCGKSDGNRKIMGVTTNMSYRRKRPSTFRSRTNSKSSPEALYYEEEDDEDDNEHHPQVNNNNNNNDVSVRQQIQGVDRNMSLEALDSFIDRKNSMDLVVMKTLLGKYVTHLKQKKLQPSGISTSEQKMLDPNGLKSADSVSFSDVDAALCKAFPYGVRIMERAGVKNGYVIYGLRVNSTNREMMEIMASCSDSVKDLVVSALPHH